MSEKTVTVKALTRLNYFGKHYAPGDTFEMRAGHVKNNTALGLVEAPKPRPKGKGKSKNKDTEFSGGESAGE